MARPATPTEVTPREEAAHAGADDGIRAGRRGLGQRFDAHRSTVVALGCAYLAMVSVAPILTTPYRSDDKLNRGIPEQIHGSGVDAVGSAIQVSLGWQKELPPGEGYVSVVWGCVGVAILMAVG